MKRKSVIILGCILILLSLGLFAAFSLQQNNKTKGNNNALDSIKVTTTPKIEPTLESEENLIVTFGDSLTAGYGLPNPSFSYPVLLQKKLDDNKLDYRIVNQGISGNTTFDGLKRVESVIKLKPKIVILELGANDALRGLDPQKASENLSLIIEKLQKENIKILLAGIQPPKEWQVESFESYRDIYPNLAKKYNLSLIPNFLEGVGGNKNLNIDDAIHPNYEGYKIIVEKNIWPYLDKLI